MLSKNKTTRVRRQTQKNTCVLKVNHNLVTRKFKKNKHWICNKLQNIIKHDYSIECGVIVDIARKLAQTSFYFLITFQ